MMVRVIFFHIYLLTYLTGTSVDPMVSSLKKQFDSYMTPKHQDAWQDLGEDIIESLEWVEKHFDKYWGRVFRFFPPPDDPKFNPGLVVTPPFSPALVPKS